MTGAIYKQGNDFHNANKTLKLDLLLWQCLPVLYFPGERYRKGMLKEAECDGLFNKLRK